MQPKTSRRGFLCATAALALGKVLNIWKPRAVALAQETNQKRPENPSQKQELAWSSQLTQAVPRSPDQGVTTVKLVVTKMATNEQSFLVLDMNESYLVELSVT